MEAKLRALRLRLMERIRVLTRNQEDISKDHLVIQIRSTIHQITRRNHKEEEEEEVPPGLDHRVSQIKTAEEELEILKGIRAHSRTSPRLKPSLRHARQEPLIPIDTLAASDRCILGSDIQSEREDLKPSSPVYVKPSPSSPGKRKGLSERVHVEKVRAHKMVRNDQREREKEKKKRMKYTTEELLDLAERAEGVMTLHEQYAKEALEKSKMLENKVREHEKYADALDTIHSDLVERAKVFANRRRFADARRILEEARDVKKRSTEQRDLVISFRQDQEVAQYQAHDYFEAAASARIEADALRVRSFATISNEEIYDDDEDKYYNETKESRTSCKRPSIPPPGLQESVAKVKLLQSIEEIERLVSSQEEEEEEEEELKKKIEIEKELKETRELLNRVRESRQGQLMSDSEWSELEREAIEKTLLRFACDVPSSEELKKKIEIEKELKKTHELLNRVRNSRQGQLMSDSEWSELEKGAIEKTLLRFARDVPSALSLSSKMKKAMSSTTTTTTTNDEEEDEYHNEKKESSSIPSPDLQEYVTKAQILQRIGVIERLVSPHGKEKEDKDKEELRKKIEIDKELKKTRELLNRARNSSRGRSMSDLEWLEFQKKAINAVLLQFAHDVPSDMSLSSKSKKKKQPPPPPTSTPPPLTPTIPTPIISSQLSFDFDTNLNENNNFDDFDSNKINFKAQVEAARRKAKQQIQAARARRQARSHFAKNIGGRGEEEWRKRYRELHHHLKNENENEDEKEKVTMIGIDSTDETKRRSNNKKTPPSFRDAQASLRNQNFTRNRFFLQARNHQKQN